MLTLRFKYFLLICLTTISLVVVMNPVFGEESISGKLLDLPGKGTQIRLSEQEATFLKDHPVIRVSSELDYAPFDFVEKGKPVGFSIDYLKLVAKRAGLKLEFVQDTWDNLVQMGQEKKIDLLHTMFYTPERGTFFRFTEPYKSVVNAIYVRDEVTGVQNLNDLAQKLVILPKGDTISEKLPQLVPDAKFVFVDNYETILKNISLGQGDATVLDSAVANYLIRKLTLTNISPAAEADIPLEDRDPRYRLAVRKDWPELQSILQKAMNTVTRDEMARLEARWFGLKIRAEKKTAGGLLSDAEQIWLDNHQDLSLGVDPDWPPYDFVDVTGNHRGMSADIMALLSERLGIRIQPVLGLNWPQVLDAAQSRKLDMVSLLLKTPERAAYLNFSSPIISSPFVIVTAKNFKRVSSLADMVKDKVSMVKGYAIVKQSKNSFPNLNVQTVDSSLAGLKAVSNGQMDAFVGNLGVVSFLIQKNGLVNLKIASEAGVESQSFAFGVRSDWPELISILNKGIADISKEEMNAIHNKWIPLIGDMSSSAKVDVISYKNLILYGIAVFIVISLLFMFLIRVMRRENIVFSFGSPWFRGLILAGLSIFVIMVAILGWYAVERNRVQHLQDVEENLRGILSLDQEHLDLWLKERISYIASLGREPELVALTRDLVQLEPDKESLLKSNGLRDVRLFFKESKNIFPNIGFSIIDSDYVSIGSMRDGNIGTRNLIAEQYPILLQRAFQGETVFVPPMTSDVHLKESPESNPATEPPIVFFLGPIRDSNGQVLAVMTLHVDPWADLAEAMKIFGSMGTGETYAFDREARMLTPSRFDDQLRRIGLLAKKQNSALNIEIRDPGVNLIKGYLPQNQRSDQPTTYSVAHALVLREKLLTESMKQNYSTIESNMEGYNDYRGVPVYGAWCWCANFNMGLVVEIDKEEALAHFYQIRATIYGILGFTVFLFVGAILFVLVVGERASRSLVRARDELEDKVAARTAELADNQEQLRLILESVGDGIFGVDVQGKIRFINSAANRLLGYEPDELIGQPVHEKVHHSHADGSHYPGDDCPMSKAYTLGSTETISDEMLWRKDGGSFSVEYMATPIKKGEEITGAVITFRDITERIRMEETLIQERERLQQILDTSPVGIAFSTGGKIHFANPMFKKMFNVGVGDSSPDLYVDQAERDIVINRVKTEGKVENYELLMKDRDGEIRDMLVTYMTIDYSGEIGVLGWLLEITDRKKAEQQIKSKLGELTRFRQMAVGREYKMIELKKEINDLLQANGQMMKYKIVTGKDSSP